MRNTFLYSQYLYFRHRLYEIGKVRGSLRDISWNLVAWASFTAVS
jgi:hypothetical protein